MLWVSYAYGVLKVRKVPISHWASVFKCHCIPSGVPNFLAYNASDT